MRKSKLQDILTKEILEYEYKNLGSMQKISDKLGVSIDSVYKYMKLHQIQYEQHYTGIYDCNHDLFSEENEKAFYLAGFIAADGSLQKRKYSKILKICLSIKDKDHLINIRNWMESNNPIKEYVVKPSKKVKRAGLCAELQIVSHQIYDDLSNFNIVPRKSLIYSLPDYLLDHKLINHFLRGVFDGDGCITNCGLGEGRNVLQKHFNILGTEKFMQQYQEVLLKNSDINGVKITQKDNVWSLSYSGNNKVQSIYDFLYKDATIYLDRKRDKFTQH